MKRNAIQIWMSGCSRIAEAGLSILISRSFLPRFNITVYELPAIITMTGPCVVMGKNFAACTTAQDLASGMEGIGGRMTSCELMATYPRVIAKMVFEERSGAQRVIDYFNGKKVGRISE